MDSNSTWPHPKLTPFENKFDPKSVCPTVLIGLVNKLFVRRKRTRKGGKNEMKNRAKRLAVKRGVYWLFGISFFTFLDVP